MIIMSTTDRFVPSAEAAFIAGVTQQQMNRLADEHLVPDSLLAKEDGSRRFARITAAWASFFFQSDDWLVASARKNILSELTARVACSKSKDYLIGLHGMTKDIDWIIVDAKIGLQLDFTAIVSQAVARAKVVDAADELITKIDSVMGGKPCFKGTRLPIEMVLFSLEKGIPEDRVLDEYSLTKEQLNAARVYAQVHPQRGRPARLGSAKPAVQ
jgi:uncharacterized protein (DUF433 family)